MPQPRASIFDSRLAAAAVVVAGMMALSAPSSASARPFCSPQSPDTALALRAAQRGYCRIPQGPHARVGLVGEVPPGLSLPQVEAALERAAAAWSAVSCSEATITYVGHYDETEEACDDETIPLIFQEIPTSEQIGAWLFESDPEEEQTYSLAVLFNLRYAWSLEPRPFTAPDEAIFDVESVFVHELGHVLGLDHQTEDPLATMRPRYLRDGGLMSLAADDKLRLCALYPGGSDECENDGDCRHRACIRRDGHAACEEERGVVGDYCAVNLLYCPGGCHISSPATGDGYCTAPCESDEECGSSFVCEEIPADSDAEEGAAPERECRLIGVEADPSCASAPVGRAPASPWAWWWLTAGVGLWAVRRGRRLT